MTYRPLTTIPQKLRSIASMILAANGMFWDDLSLGIDQIGEDLYQGISEDLNSTIQKTWVKLGEVNIKEISSDFAPKGTFVKWGLYLRVENKDGKDFGKAHFVQLSHRRGITLTHEQFHTDLDTDEHPTDIISH